MSLAVSLSGWAARRLGIAALKECPVIMWFESVNSDSNFPSHKFNFAFVNIFPDLNLKTGLSLFQIPAETAIFLSLIRARAGHRFKL